jgi:hypothetical protein
MSSKSPQPLIHIDDANVYLAKIDDDINRSLASNILAEIENFYRANRSSLETPCDLAFVSKVLDYGLKGTLDLLRGIVDEALYWSDELPKLMIASIDPQKDSTEHTRRIIQAENYCAQHSDKWMAAVLAGVLSDAGLMIRARGPKFRYNPGPNRPRVPAALPVEPLDCLFLVQALDYALRPDGPVRTIIQAHESSQARRSEDM